MARLRDIAAGSRVKLVRAGDVFLRAYSQLLFSRSRAVGLLLLLATATGPRALLCGVLAVATAFAVARLIELEAEAVDSGAYGYNALLVGLGVGQTFSGGGAIVLVMFAAIASVFVTAALRASLGATTHLPVLSLPFLAVFPLCLGAASFLGLGLGPPLADSSGLAALLPAPVVGFVHGLGGLFFLPRVDAGALVLLALLLHSRIAALLAAFGFALIVCLDAWVLTLPPVGMIGELGLNAIFIAVTLGGVWYVPSAASFALAALGVLMTAMISLGLAPPLAGMGLPALVLPFNLAALIMLAAMRQRSSDRCPKSVDFLSGTPEENLTHAQTRFLRFQWLYPVSIHLPFRGQWVCTQGVDGAFTHQGAWRHSFDFEVQGEDGRLFTGSGTSLEDFHCFRLPVLAAADGTVVEVENGVVDNPVGALNLAQNWGNLVLIYHGPGLYSLVAHLAHGSAKVVKGQYVRCGEQLGLVGNSGRSPSPHIHFHLQATPVIGASTIPCSFNDIVLTPLEVAPRMAVAHTPLERDALRNLAPEEETAACFAFALGQRLRFQVGKRTEELVAEVDLHGKPLLRSADRPAALYYGNSESCFTAWDAVGAEESVVHLLRAALSRVPFEAGDQLRWTDILPARRFRALPVRLLVDFVAPFLLRDGIEVVFRMRRAGASLIVEGESRRRDRRGDPVVQTRAELVRGVGPTRVEVKVRGQTRTAVLSS